MNTSIPQVTIQAQENIQARAARVILITIGDHLCYPKFKCLHLEFVDLEQLKKNLANNYGASDEELHAKLFGENQKAFD